MVVFRSISLVDTLYPGFQITYSVLGVTHPAAVRLYIALRDTTLDGGANGDFDCRIDSL